MNDACRGTVQPDAAVFVHVGKAVDVRAIEHDVGRKVGGSRLAVSEIDQPKDLCGRGRRRNLEADAAKLAHIVTPGGGLPALATAKGAHNWRFIGSGSS